jgi:hypothetical protein
MTRTEQAEIATVHQRIKAAAKLTTKPCYRQAAQLRYDLGLWESFTLAGYDLPKLPCRILRRQNAPCASAQPTRTKNENKVPKNLPQKAESGTKPVNKALPLEKMLELLASDQSRCLLIAAALVQRMDTAQDVLQQCMESAMDSIWAGVVRAGNDAQFFAWLHQVVRFSCYKFVKRQKPRSAAYNDESTADPYIVDEYAEDAYRTVGRSKTPEGHGPDE